MFKVPEKRRVESAGGWSSTAKDGNNGLFQWSWGNRIFTAIASDGGGWEHVSVSLRAGDRSLTWDEMCKVKAMFWDEDDTVVQFCPPKYTYNKNQPCARWQHLWCSKDMVMPSPPMDMV